MTAKRARGNAVPLLIQSCKSTRRARTSAKTMPQLSLFGCVRQMAAL